VPHDANLGDKNLLVGWRALTTKGSCKTGKLMARPAHLPEYGSPPLDEVVLGIQFNPAAGYQQIRAGEVWALYRDKFPVVEEQQRLAPTFETFGPTIFARPAFQLVQGAEHDRFWFVNKAGDELIQFQSDRLLHNWRRRVGVDRPYPRFDEIAGSLSAEAKALERYFDSLEQQTLDVNQCEMTYINHFPIDDGGEFQHLSDYLKVVTFEDEPDDGAIQYRRTIRADDGTPIARLYCESNAGIRVDGAKVITLNISVRGAPRDSTIDGALAYLKEGRRLIVTEFTSITTDKAHRLWERSK